jgi:flagellar protein FlbT
MYLKNDVPRYQASYLGILQELRDSLQDSCPGSSELIAAVNHHVSDGALYKALKEIRKLMKREDERTAA